MQAFVVEENLPVTFTVKSDTEYGYSEEIPRDQMSGQGESSETKE